ncbi:UDP-3-O-(3-hydroxymyristoyl)glucosamine N-acyltransferase [Nodosilinea sp. LEGE 07298]|uniref:UDP-3-O-(3-hydroxymyristoyl)glucosamine N-acyltransferase n=1 Tax=Nodosilinea sp. LEGE 07298 TaxID=2777970 RepID=UPI001881DBAE|nr:UDP-3-O-(3-hydroxymyristoyl)glucosamine N-acyltransferase [Nodosilinea sp. LEGE 07298]MBE9110767.1 UDP-3-O-(3-hydroxymyristoyl)glucosamine N-acyltransferase [Nodosilinea sp. LEGE 07298]
MKFSTIADKIQITAASSLITDPSHDPDIIGVAAVDQASTGTLSYIEGEKFAAFVANTQASALILPQNPAMQAQATDRGLAWLSAPDPRLAFARAIALFYTPYQPGPGIHPSAVVDPTVTCGEQVSIGANAVIQAGVRLGTGVCVHPNVVIYPGVQVGDRTVLHANCVIHERAQIGADCTIHSGAVVGAEGFGFVPTSQGWEKMEQSGIVVIEDGVRVGSNTTIDRPAVGTTRVGRDTKLDNLVHIAHGCQVGEGVAMAAQVGMAGGVIVGNRVILAGQVGVANQAKIGDGAIATAQTGIHGNVAPGEIVAGSPALPHKVFLKASAVYRRLPEMYKTLQQLQKRLP